MNNDRSSNDFTEDGADLYPHFTITNEAFPRILATRRFEDDGSEYYGAFLTKTAVRIMIDFLNRTFRLRSCDIDIDGNFPVPCTQFYLKRCLAPCVENLCDRGRYLEMVGLARLFLSNQRVLLAKELNRRIGHHSENLEFEEASRWRDILLAVEDYWSNPRIQVWLNDTVDTYVADETIAGSFIYLATQRGRNVLGRKVFPLPRGGGMSPDEAVERIIGSFYRFHLPREIRVSMDFEGRGRLASELGERFGRPVKILVTRPDKNLITSIRALRLARSENDLEFAKAKATPRQISGELRRLFDLDKLPNRVEAFDVAHISGKSFASASAVWQEGRFVSEEYRFSISDEQTELAAMAEAVQNRLADSWRKCPNIILLDGGKTQMNAVMNKLGKDFTSVAVVGAVKPRGEHSSVAHFLTSDGEEIPYDPDNPAQNMLRLLRDNAHDLANRVHRDLRDLGHHYELAGLLPTLNESERRSLVMAAGSVRKLREINRSDLLRLAAPNVAARAGDDLDRTRGGRNSALPFIVPIRFTAENGDADDLRPINWR